jgi:hypothetical protein
MMSTGAVPGRDASIGRGIDGAVCALFDASPCAARGAHVSDPGGTSGVAPAIGVVASRALWAAPASAESAIGTGLGPQQRAQVAVADAPRTSVTLPAAGAGPLPAAGAGPLPTPRAPAHAAPPLAPARAPAAGVAGVGARVEARVVGAAGVVARVVAALGCEGDRVRVMEAAELARPRQPAVG